MRQWIRSHLTYANVMVTILAFIVLGGGTAMAAFVVSSNSQIGPGTVSGHKPPSGDHANIIAGSVKGTDLASGLRASLTLHCPSGLQPVPDQAPVLCSETSLRVRDTYATALKRCAAVNLRLPTDAELALVFEHSGAPQEGQWTSSHYFDSTVNHPYASALGMDASRNLLPQTGAADNPIAYRYRCVTSPTN